MTEIEDIVADAEDRWVTVRVFQGFEDTLSYPIDENYTFVIDEDGGIWTPAFPAICKKEGKHLPRWHPSEYIWLFYCVRCGMCPVDPPSVSSPSS